MVSRREVLSLEGIIVGSTCGIIIGLVVIGVTPVIIISRKDTPTNLNNYLKSHSSLTGLFLPLTFLTQVFLAIIGLIIGVVYSFLPTSIAGPGLGSPNYIFTLGIMLFSLIIFLPILLSLRTAWKGISIIHISFAGIFGWLLPHIMA